MVMVIVMPRVVVWWRSHDDGVILYGGLGDGEGDDDLDHYLEYDGDSGWVLMPKVMVIVM